MSDRGGDGFSHTTLVLPLTSAKGQGSLHDQILAVADPASQLGPSNAISPSSVTLDGNVAGDLANGDTMTFKLGSGTTFTGYTVTASPGGAFAFTQAKTASWLPCEEVDEHAFSAAAHFEFFAAHSLKHASLCGSKSSSSP